MTTLKKDVTVSVVENEVTENIQIFVFIADYVHIISTLFQNLFKEDLAIK